MKKIAFVVTTPMRRQGMTSVVVNLLRHLPQDDFKVICLTALPAEEWFVSEMETLGVEFIRLTASRVKQNRRYIRELAGHLRTHEVDVLHVHGNSSTMWFEIRAAKVAGVPIRIAHSHSSSGLNQTVHRLLRPLLIRDMTLGIGCSDLSRKFAFQDRNSIVLNNGIDTEKFAYNAQVRERYRAEFGLQNSFVIGHIGNLVPVKNHGFLLRVALEMKRRGVMGVHFLLAGEGELRGEIERLIQTYELANMVTLLGSRADPENLYQMFDLFLLPSLYEGFPMVLVEAQTAGVNCLISEKVTQTTDLLGTAKYLPIYEEVDVQAWADAITNAMDHTPRDDRCLAIRRVESAGYSIQKSVEILMDIYMHSGGV